MSYISIIPEMPDSPYKTSINIVALANLYARILVNEQLSATDLRRKTSYIKTLSLSESDNEYYSTKFLEDIQNEELYNISADLD